MDCWSKLPEHLIEIFAEKLDSHRDFLSFSAVCTSWRSVFKNNIHCLPSKIPISYCLPKGKPLPLLVHYSAIMDSKIHSLFSLNEKRMKISIEIDLSKTKNKWIMGSWRGWLFVVDYMTHEIALIKPLTDEEVRLPSFPSYTTLSLFRIKNVVFSYPLGNKYDWIVMFACNHINISFCRVGDDKWNIHTHSQGIVDLINHNGIFYVLDTNHDLYKITMMKNTIDMKFVLVWRTFGDPRRIFTRKFLVESSGELLLVTHALMVNKHLDGIPYFEIFKLTTRYFNYNELYFRKECEWQKIEDIGNYNELYFRKECEWQKIEDIGNYNELYFRKECEWQKIEDIDTQTMFLGRNGSISVESSLYPGIKGNCIYFPHIIDGNLRIVVCNLITWSVEYFSLDVDANLDEVLWFSPNPW